MERVGYTPASAGVETEAHIIGWNGGAMIFPEAIRNLQGVEEVFINSSCLPGPSVLVV